MIDTLLVATAPELSVTLSCTVTLPGAVVPSVALLALVTPLNAAMATPAVMLHW